jgi:hypothetical protein
MRVLMVSLSMLAFAACSGRQVEVRTGPEPATETAIHLTNNLSQAVNVCGQRRERHLPQAGFVEQR